MFNDLNSPNGQSRPAVDDIFAETDKTAEGSAPNNPNLANSGIETRRVGLTATDGVIREESEKIANNKWFKIILVIIIAVILILSGYLVYSRFFKAGLNSAKDLNSVSPATTNQPVSPTAPVTPVSDSNNSGSFVAPTNGGSAANGTTTIPEIPGVNVPANTTISTTTPIMAPVITPSSTPSIDSDSDGLSDAEEKAAGTNINVIDTDNDGLSDYEEVKIYHTNPLSADTDGDGYLDGAEVKSGYNPNGPGKLVKPAVK